MIKIKFIILSGLLLFIGIVSIFRSISSVNFYSAQTPTRQDTLSVENATKISFPDSLVATINFPVGKFALSQMQTQQILSTIENLDQGKRYLIILDGYADSTGMGTVNNSLLAARRSYSVYECLINHGISKEVICIRAFGVSAQRMVDVSVAEVQHL